MTIRSDFPDGNVEVLQRKEATFTSVAHTREASGILNGGLAVRDANHEFAFSRPFTISPKRKRVNIFQ